VAVLIFYNNVSGLNKPVKCRCQAEQIYGICRCKLKKFFTYSFFKWFNIALDKI